MEKRRLTIPGRYACVRKACDFVIAAAQSAGLNEQDQFHCQVAVDEACTNIIEHGYQGEDGGEIEVLVHSPAAGTLAIELHDWARPFDIDAVPVPDPAAPLEERRVGGWGLYFIREMMDQVDFEREGDTNIVRFLKRGQNKDSQPEK